MQTIPTDNAVPPPLAYAADRPTAVRYWIVALAATNALLLYLDRMCMGAVVQSASFHRELGLTKEATGTVLSCFFIAYAVGQLPAGWLADRFGARRMLGCYVLLWSIFTASTGFAHGLYMLVAARVGTGLAEAGAYPASGRMMRNWFPLTQRARANSVIAFGGRFGGAAAFYLTALLIAALGAWRPVLWLYGSIGIALGILSWIVFRDRPTQHPWANGAERALAPPADAPTTGGFPLLKMATHPGLWALNLASIGNNLGWAFLVTWFPTYLTEVHKLDPVRASKYVTLTLLFGTLGMLFGGYLTDRATVTLGVRWGRRAPFLICASAAAITYLACAQFHNVYAIIGGCCLVAFLTDSMVPAQWAFGQDVGGRHTAAAIGWSNAWGNLGASVTPGILPWALRHFDPHGNWHAAFLICAGGFLLTALSAFGLDARRTLEDPAGS